jgi:hypothetical protein
MSMKFHAAGVARFVLPLLVGVFCLFLVEDLMASDSLLISPDRVPSGWTQLAAKWYGAANASRGADGDADLYLECGLDSLVVARLKNDQKQLVLRFHHLVSPAAALAMYLVKCGPEQPSPNLGCRHTLSSSQLLAVRGNWVLNISALGDQDSTLAETMTALAAAMLPTPPADSLVPLLDSLPRVDRSPGSERVVVGTLTFPSALHPLGPELLGISLRRYAVASDYRKKNGDRSTMLLQSYADERAAEDAFTQLGMMLSRARRLSDRTRSTFKFRSQANEPVTVKVKKNHLTITIDRGES